MKTIAAYLIAFVIGFLCKKFGVSIPAPPTMSGVGLIAAITIGYIITKK